MAKVDEKEIEELYRKHIGLLRARAVRILRNKELGEDLAQEAMIRFVEYRKGGNRERDTLAFLYRTVSNLSLNYLRDARNRQRLLGEKVAPAVSQPEGENAEEKARQAMLLRKALSESRSEDALVALHYYIDGMDQAEIGDLLRLPRRTVGRRLERFRKETQKLLVGEARS